ncbi:G-protein coupled receptor [Aphelenchoides besseyi]|nr:G-protein coupled receptor [Aphelenchoides besseyi]
MNRSSSVEFVNASCRFSTNGHYEPSIFRSVACAQCFFYIFLAQPPYNFSMNIKICSDGLLACDLGDSNCNCQTSEYPKYNLLEFSNSPLVLSIRELQIDPPLPEGFEEATRDCCKTAEKCCFEVLQHDIEIEGTCPSTWDGWQCFNRTIPGVTRQFCPSYIYGDRWHQRVENGAEKKCNKNGKWELVMRDGVQREQTNYMSCHQEDFWLRPLLLCTFIAYCISALTIVPALLLLSCNRYPICRLLFVLQYGYFRLTSFAWMLVEALHLHWLLFRTPSNHIESVNRMLLCTWASPAIVSVIYGVLIEYYEPDRCMPEAKTPLIKALITIPCAMCLMVY